MSAAPRHPVLLHGFTGSSAAWGAGVVDGLAGLGLSPTLVDLPGHGRHAGRTEAAEFTLDATLAEISAAGDWPTDLVGYSMGGRIALHYAAAYPGRVDKLVLESASPGLATPAERAERRSADEALAQHLVDEGIEAFVDFWESQPLFASRSLLDRSVRERQRTLRLSNDPRSLAAALRGLGTGTLPSLWERLPELTTRTLLIAGALDRRFVRIAERMAARMPDARLVVVPDAGHTVHLERPDHWLGTVASFLAST